MTVKEDKDTIQTDVAPSAPSACLDDHYKQASPVLGQPSVIGGTTNVPLVPATPVNTEEPFAVTGLPVPGSMISRPTTTIPPPQTTTSYPPPGVADGGAWGSARYCGPNTWGVGTLISAWTCFFLFFPCGIFAVFCPCDERDVYSVNGRIYDARGKDVGSSKKFNGPHFR